MDEPLPILVLVSDLIFSSRISAEARAAASPIKMIRQPNLLAGQPGRRLIVDLNLPGAIFAAAQWRKNCGGEVIGFVSHSDLATIAEARTAGLDQVLPRSRFVEVLPELLKSPNHA
jgi:DNA-binding NarL/FixJ family response regulator